jgi:hypothetical protein
MLTRETYARQEMPWPNDATDPITRLRDAFPGKPAVAAEELTS